MVNLRDKMLLTRPDAVRVREESCITPSAEVSPG